MKRRIFFDTDPAYNCTRIECPNALGELSVLPITATDVREVDEAVIPVDRTFRNAWKANLSVDMAKAREIWTTRLQRQGRLNDAKAAAIATAMTTDALKLI